jgi:glycosyltransferase involved in cell wall biosynthesis
VGPIGTTQPVVAIVMRTKDRPVLLRRALADVCAQTFGDWQLVLVNDGGDPSEVDRLLAAHGGLRERTTVLHNEQSRGMEVASNQAIRASDSRYIAIHDDDDSWHATFLERTVAHLDATGEAAVAVRTEIVWEHVDGDTVTEQSRELMVPEIHSFTLFEMLRLNRTVPISILYRRDVHDEVGPFREDLTVVGDWEFHLRLALSRRPLGFIDGQPLAFWHQRREADGSLANSVIARLDDHRELDLKVREEALRQYARTHGLGELLYLTKYFQREIDLVHDRITYGEGRQDELIARLGQLHETLEKQGAELLAQQTDVLERQRQLLAEQNERLAHLEQAISDASLVSLIRRRYRRLKDRLLGRG